MSNFNELLDKNKYTPLSVPLHVKHRLHGMKLHPREVYWDTLVRLMDHWDETHIKNE